jgi:hypothetical protein
MDVSEIAWLSYIELRVEMGQRVSKQQLLEAFKIRLRLDKMRSAYEERAHALDDCEELTLPWDE